ncbi:hypothetical protein HPP92_007544 [Vanilla planifolia]|uniref:Btz domain-containing protein n=1 Tax=Vanilla planifolia TaxID=51239 RepID=A0A835RKN5_VANPL|nr:hypothetical protein HPP92_007544 [Vanilla planifolia]
MSRRERDGRDSQGKRLHSRFDREPSPKKVKREEKSGPSRTHSSHHHSSVKELTDHKQKQEVQDEVPFQSIPVSNIPDHYIETKNLEGKDDRTRMDTQHSSEHRDVLHSHSYYQHSDRGSAGWSSSRRAIDHRRWNDSKEQSRNRIRAEEYDQHKKDERPHSRADEKNTGIWRHDRFKDLEPAVPPARKRPAFREKKLPTEPDADASTKGSEKPKLSTREPPMEWDTGRREEKSELYPRVPDKPSRSFPRVDDRRERRVDGFYQRVEMQRSIDPSGERYGVRGRADRPDFAYGERNSLRAGGFEVEKWKHDLFDEANQSPPRKNEEEHIAKVEALLAL